MSEPHPRPAHPPLRAAPPRRRGMRRFRAAAALVTAVAVLAGCGGGGNGAAKAAGAGQELTGDQLALAKSIGLKTDKPYAGTKLNFLICCNTASQFAELIDKTNTEFKDLTGIQVTWANTPYASYQQKVVAEATTGGGAYDLVAWVDAWGASIKGALEPLNDRIKQAGIDMNDFPKAYQDAVKLATPDTYYGIPLRGHAYLEFYRKDVYDKLGLKPAETWDQLVTNSQKVQDATDLYGTAMHYGRGGDQNVFTFLSMLWGNGGTVFDSSGKAAINSPQAVEAAKKYVGFLRDSKITPPESLTWNEQEATQSMAKGKTASFIGWSWIYANLTGKDADPTVAKNVGFAPTPHWDGKEGVSYAQLWPVGLLKASKQKDAAWEYIKWLTSPVTEKSVLLMPGHNVVVSVHNSNLNDDAVNARSNGLQKAMAESLKTARTVPMISQWPQVEARLEVAINEMATGADPQSTLDKAASDIDGIMKGS